MTPVSKTAYYCCGVRMMDAESANPVCNDTYARLFMDEEGLRMFDAFRNEEKPNASNVTRHRIVDDILRDELTRSPDLTIVIVGCGFDSRAFRIKGGTWIELDEPAIIAYKNEKLDSSSCPNELHRIRINFAAESLDSKLPRTSNRVVVVIEGVFMYLTENITNQLLQTLRRVFPSHILLCDLMSQRFFEKYGKPLHEKIKKLGAQFAFVADDPSSLFLRHGYVITDRISTVEKSIDYGLIRIPKWLLRLFFNTLVNGYRVYRLELNSHHKS
jgi:methyltransferase (TIGR00027 family)